MDTFKRFTLYLTLTMLILAAPSFMVYSAITQQAGLAVAQTTTLWNDLRDMVTGDGQTKGVALQSPCLWNGASCDRARGDIANGQQVNVTKLPASVGFAPVQTGSLFNSRTVSAANTATVVTITGVANQRIHLYKLQTRCSNGGSFLTIADGATTIYETDGGTITAGTQYQNFEWNPGLTFTSGQNAVITVAACGTGNISVTTVQADQF